MCESVVFKITYAKNDRFVHSFCEKSGLDEQVEKATPQVATGMPPLTEMLRHISASYGRFAIESETPQDQLEAQLNMVDWYLERSQFVHAISLAREWLPSLLCVYYDVDMMDKNEREDMELLLNGGKIKDKNGGTIKESQRLNQWGDVPAGKQLRSLWGGQHNLANLRNDVLHAGFRKNPKTPDEIEDAIKAIVTEMKDIWQQFQDIVE